MKVETRFYVRRDGYLQSQYVSEDKQNILTNPQLDFILYNPHFYWFIFTLILFCAFLPVYLIF